MYSLKFFLSLGCLFTSLLLINSGYAVTNDSSQIAYYRGGGDRSFGGDRGMEGNRGYEGNRSIQPYGEEHRYGNEGYGGYHGGYGEGYRGGYGGYSEYNRGYVAPLVTPQEPVYVLPPTTTTQPQQYPQ